MGVKYGNFHTTALCSPTRASLLTGRNATSNGMATIAEFSSGFPGISTRIPFENGLHLRGPRRARLQHVLRRQVAPDSGRGVQPIAALQEALATGTRLRAVLRLPRRRVELAATRTSSTTTTRSSRRPRRRTAITSRRTCPTRRSGSSAMRRPSIQTSPSSCTSPCMQRHAPHHVFRGVGRQVQGRLRRAATRRFAPASWRDRTTWAYFRPTPSCPPINPHGEPGATGPDGQPWPTARHGSAWDTLADDEKRLFTRMAEIFAGYVEYTDDQARAGHRLPPGGGRPRQHHHRGDVGQRRPAARAVRTGRSTSSDSSTAFPPPRNCRWSTSTNSVARSRYNHYNTGWAWAFDTPFPYWKRWAGLRRRHRGHVPGVVAREGGRRPRTPFAVCPRSRRRPDDLRPHRHHAAGRPQWLRAELRSRARASRRRSPIRPRRRKSTQFYAMLGQRALYDDGWLACTLHPPLSGWGKFEQDVWELYHVEVDRSQSTNLADPEPERVERMKTRWFELRRAVQRPARWTTERRWSRRLPSGPAGSPKRGPVRLLPGLRLRPRTVGRPPSRAAPTPSRPASTWTDRTSPASSSRTVAVSRRAQPVRAGRAPHVRLQLGRHLTSRPSPPIATSHPVTR